MTGVGIVIRRTERLLAVSAAPTLAAATTGCGADDDNPIADGSAMTTTAAPTITTSAESQYFADGDHVGEQVDITAPVDADLTDGSVVLDAGAYGDESLLVLFKGGEQEFAEGQTVTVISTVRQFFYDDYADDYGLLGPALFDAHADEEFLAAESVVAGSSTPSS